MVANVGPADWNYDETLSTLRCDGQLLLPMAVHIYMETLSFRS